LPLGTTEGKTTRFRFVCGRPRKYFFPFFSTGPENAFYYKKPGGRMGKTFFAQKSAPGRIGITIWEKFWSTSTPDKQKRQQKQ